MSLDQSLRTRRHADQIYNSTVDVSKQTELWSELNNDQEIIEIWFGGTSNFSLLVDLIRVVVEVESKSSLVLLKAHSCGLSDNMSDVQH